MQSFIHVIRLLREKEALRINGLSISKLMGMLMRPKRIILA